MNRNELVSRVNRTAPNRFSIDAAFLQGLLTVVVPLVGLTLTLFNGRIRALFDPVLVLLH